MVQEYDGEKMREWSEGNERKTVCVCVFEMRESSRGDEGSDGDER